MEKTDQIKTLNILYSTYNYIDSKYKNNNHLTGYELYFVKAIACSMSIIRNDYLDVKTSLTGFYNYRIIIESLLIMNMLENSKEDSGDLLSKYSLYMDYQFLIDKCKNKKEIKEVNKNMAKEFGSETANLLSNGAFLNNMIYRKYPFLGNIFSFINILKDTDIKMYELYYELKVLTEVGSNDAKLMAINIIDKDLVKKCNELVLEPFLKTVNEYYLKNNIELINKYDNDFYIINTLDKEKYYKIQLEEINILKELAKLLDYSNDLFELKKTIIILSESLEEILYDFLDDSIAIYLLKAKVLYETLAISFFSLLITNLTSNKLGIFERKKQAFTDLRFNRYKFLGNNRVGLSSFNNDVKIFKYYYCNNHNIKINYSDPLFYLESDFLTLDIIVDKYFELMMPDSEAYCMLGIMYFNSKRILKCGNVLNDEIKSSLDGLGSIDTLLYFLLQTYYKSIKEEESFHIKGYSKNINKTDLLLDEFKTNVMNSIELLTKILV